VVQHYPESYFEGDPLPLVQDMVRASPVVLTDAGRREWPLRHKHNFSEGMCQTELSPPYAAALAFRQTFPYQSDADARLLTSASTAALVES
jgi:hypothetical protein